MNEREHDERLMERRREQFDDCRGRQFVLKTFASYPSLRSIGPEAWDDQDSYHISVPYTGQEYDEKAFEVVDDGWDHEHCPICNTHIDPGDEYWQSDQPHPLELCLACHRLLSVDPT